MRRFLSPFRGQSRNVVILSFVSFFNDISSESIGRILPVFLRESARASFTAIGWVEGVADALSIVLRLVSGWIVDSFHKKKPFLIFGYGLSAMVRPLFPTAVANLGWAGALSLKVTDRIGKAVRVVPRDALIAIETPSEKRGAGFGLNRMLDTLGALLGIIMAALILDYLSAGDAQSDLLSANHFKIIVIAASVFGFISVALIVFGVKERAFTVNTDIPLRAALSGSVRDLPKSFFWYLGAVCLFSLAGSSDAFLILRLRSVGFSLPTTLWLIAGYNLLAALTVYPISKLSDKLPGRQLPILAGWIIYALTYLVFGLGSGGVTLSIAFVGYGLYYGFVESTEKALVADLVPRTHLGRAYGIFNFATGLMLLPANLIFGLIADVYGMPSAFATGAILALAAALVLSLLKIRRPVLSS